MFKCTKKNGLEKSHSGAEIVAFCAPVSRDTTLRGGISATTNTVHYCISAMKEYENKSMEVSAYSLLSEVVVTPSVTAANGFDFGESQKYDRFVDCGAGGARPYLTVQGPVRLSYGALPCLHAAAVPPR